MTHECSKLIHLLYQTTRAISQDRLASYLHIEPATISKTIIKLEEKGIIEASLTEKALSRYTIWEKAINKHRQSILVDLSDEKQHELYVILESVYSNSQKCKM